MAVSLNVGLKQTQKLVMTQSLKQAIELLQLSTLELSERIAAELMENPVLEEVSQSLPVPEMETPLAGAVGDSPLEGEEIGFNEKEEQFQEFSDASDDGYHNHFDEDRKRDFIENAVAVQETLAEHLLWQARMVAPDAASLELFENIITSLDRNGFLTGGLDDFVIADRFTSAAVRETVETIRLFDPVGCAAGNVRESLLIQARCYFTGDMVLHRLIEEHFEDLEKLNYEKIGRSLGLSVQEILEKSKLLHNLEPFPGRRFSTKENRYIVPDIEVRFLDGEILVTLNDDWVPAIRINSYYMDLIRKKNVEKKLKEYIQDKLQSARYLIKNITSRRDTIIKVVKAIMEHQSGFLRKGPGHLKPLTHIEIAQEIGMHESTVSRVTSNKFVQTSWGVFELKYFFVSRLKTSNKSEEPSSDNAMKLIKDIISGENPVHPFSDEEIVDMLMKTGITVARRTIAKYRGILNIPSSTRRKKINLLKVKGSL